MSSLLDRDSDPDALSPYAPKRVRDAAHAGPRGTAPKSQEAVKDGDAQQWTASSAPDEGLLIDRYRLPPSLEPAVMPEPRHARSSIGVLAGFAIVIATAIVALFVVGKSPTPWSEKNRKEEVPSLGSRFSGQNARTAEQPTSPVPQLNLRQEGPRKSGEAFPLGASLTGTAEDASVVVEGLADGSIVTVGQSSGANTWRIPISDLHNALVQPPRDYAGAMNIVLELRLADDAPVDRKPLRLEWAATEPPQVNAPTPSRTDLRPAFEQFVENYTASTGKRTFSARERETLFKKFQQFLDRK
jgi:hypothetical protein